MSNDPEVSNEPLGNPIATESGLKYQLSIVPCSFALESRGKRVDDRQYVMPVVLDLSMNGADRS